MTMCKSSVENVLEVKLQCWNSKLTVQSILKQSKTHSALHHFIPNSISNSQNFRSYFYFIFLHQIA